jgi:hypothetical protein
MSKRTKKQADGTEVEVETETIKVQGPQGGRRRCGFTFGPEPVDVEVTREQFDAILADPHLKLVK